jgi:thiamine biosynthesis lipoprotein
MSRSHNRARSRRLAAAGLAALLAAVASAAGAPAAAGATRARYLMGTTLRIEIPAGAPESAFEEAFAEVARLEDVLSNWRPDSEVSRLNRSAGTPFRCSADLYDALREALRWAAETGGAFDPTVEPLVRARGLRDGDGVLPGADGAALRDRPPGAPAAVGWRLLRLDPERRVAVLEAPGAGIDFGGIGKGIALDAAVRRLRDGGVDAALLDFGGQVAVFGTPPGLDGWTVAVADPAARDRPTLSFRLRDASAATSGNSERGAGPAGGHILDPASGRPAPFEGSVTVVMPQAIAADALSTALFVMGPEAGLEWAGRRGVAALYLSRGRDGGVRRRATRAFDRLADGDGGRRDADEAKRAAGRTGPRAAPAEARHGPCPPADEGGCP